MTGHAFDMRTSARMRPIARVLAMACLAGVADPLEIRRRCCMALGKNRPWLVALTQDLVQLHATQVQARDLDALCAAILRNKNFRRMFEFGRPAPEASGYFRFEPGMLNPPQALSAVHLPALATPGELARWLGISVDELEWLADPGGWRQQHQGPLCHYRYRWIDKRSGGSRLLEIPKSQLRRIQRQILHHILAQVPAHDAAHGCVIGRSIFSNAAPHADRGSLLRVDLAGFFTSIRASRIHAIFETLGYPAATARYLAAFTTHATPAAALHPDGTGDPRAVRSRVIVPCNPELRSRHLPQGAPTSPALANLAAWRLDMRLAQAADASGARYTRYVDDLFFSSETLDRQRMKRFADMVYAIICEEGFEPNFRKTRFMARATSQRVTGLTVNAFPNIDRREYDRLKAILSNCARHGAHHQNRSHLADFKAHLLGRIGFVEHANPNRGAKLRALMASIDWSIEDHQQNRQT